MKKLFVATIALGFILGFACCKNECKCSGTEDGIKYEVTHPESEISKSQCKALNDEMKEYGVDGKCVWR